MIVPAGTGNSNYLAHWGNLPWPEALALALATSPPVAAAPGPAGSTVPAAGDRMLVMLGACSGLIAEALLVAPDIR